MRREDILSFTRGQPFRPFRVTLTSGETFDTHHPDMIVPTLGMATIARPPVGGPPDVAEVVVHVSFINITKIEYLASPMPVGANGSPQTP